MIQNVYLRDHHTPATFTLLLTPNVLKHRRVPPSPYNSPVAKCLSAAKSKCKNLAQAKVAKGKTYSIPRQSSPSGHGKPSIHRPPTVYCSGQLTRDREQRQAQSLRGCQTQRHAGERDGSGRDRCCSEPEAARPGPCDGRAEPVAARG